MFHRLNGAIEPDGKIWAAIPKKKAEHSAGITFDSFQAIALKLDLVDNKVTSFSDMEYGVQFVIRKEKRN